MLKRCLIFTSISLIFSISIFAEIIKIRTNGSRVFRIEKDIILNGPNGYLKSALKNDQAMITRCKDGALFVNVGSTAMRIALDYIKHGELDRISSSIVKKELSYLLPELQDILAKNDNKKPKIWRCGAYCYAGHNSGLYSIKEIGFLITASPDIFKAWQNLNDECHAKKPYYNDFTTLTSKKMTLNQNLDSQATTMRSSCIKERP
jgi:hypothetical protein